MFHTFSPPFSSFRAHAKNLATHTNLPACIQPSFPFRRGDSRIARSHAPLNRASSLLSGQASPTARPRPRPSAFRFTLHSVIQSASEESGNLRQPTRLYLTEFPFRRGDSRIARSHTVKPRIIAQKRHHIPPVCV